MTKSYVFHTLPPNHDNGNEFEKSLIKLVEKKSDVVIDEIPMVVERGTNGNLVGIEPANINIYNNLQSYHIINNQFDKLLIYFCPLNKNPNDCLEVINYLYAFGSVVVFNNRNRIFESNFTSDIVEINSISVWEYYVKKYGAKNIILVGSKGGCQNVAGICSYLTIDAELPLAVVLDEPICNKISHRFLLPSLWYQYSTTKSSNTIYSTNYQTFNPLIKILIMHNLNYPSYIVKCGKSDAQTIAESLQSYHPWVRYIEVKGPINDFVVNSQIGEFLSSLID
jgi:hypothetical protein